MQQINPFAVPNAPVNDIPINQGTSKINIFTAKGRLGRIRYFYYSMLATFVGITAIAGWFLKSSTVTGGIALAIVSISLITWSFLLVIQRCHDLNKSGWWSLLIFIPFAFLYFNFASGTQGANHYGAEPPTNSAGVIAGAIIMLPVFIGFMGIIASIILPAYSDYIKRVNHANAQIEAAQTTNDRTRSY